MSTWVGCIVETRGRADFWDVARRHGATPLVTAVPAYALIDFGAAFEASMRIAGELSRELETSSLGFVVQTSADVHQIHAFLRGERVRRLDYSRDEGGWLADEGDAQPWEARYFLNDDMLWDELSEEDVARFERARGAGDARPVMDLIHPSSARPMMRVCEFFGVSADAPSGRWNKPSLVARLFGRS